MAPKALLVLGVLMAVLLVISSEVTARDMAETAKERQTEGAVNKDHYGEGHGCHHGCCGGWHHGECGRCCTHESEVPDAAVQDAVTDHHDFHCHHGCCGWHHGECVHCCGATDVETEVKPHD